MMNKNIINKKQFSNRAYLIFFVVMIFGTVNNQVLGQSGKWVAPENADKIENPYIGVEKSILSGELLYQQMCAICHGKKGKGDGVAGMALTPRPSNFTKDKIQSQTDGAIYWKMTQGKAPMASYKESLTEEQRWHLVNFIRSLK